MIAPAEMPESKMIWKPDGNSAYSSGDTVGSRPIPTEIATTRMLELLNLTFGQGPYAAGRDHAEQGDARTAQHRQRDALDDAAQLRQQAEDDQHPAGEGRDVARPDPGQ